MDYLCAMFDDCTFSCFGFTVQTNTQTDRQTDTQRHTESHTDAANRYTHATTGGVSKYD